MMGAGSTGTGARARRACAQPIGLGGDVEGHVEPCCEASGDATTGRGRSPKPPQGHRHSARRFPPVQILVCRNCGGVVVFGADGWRHRDADRPCPGLVVAWPPPSDREDD